MLGVAPRQSDDPPAHLSHTRRNTRTRLHPPLFGLKLQEKMKAAGVDCTVHYKFGPTPDADTNGVDLVARQSGLD